MARNMIYDYYEHSLIEENYQQKEQRRPTYDDLIEEELYARELSLLIDIAVEKKCRPTPEHLYHEPERRPEQ